MAARLTALRLAGRLTPISSTCPSRSTVMGSVNIPPGRPALLASDYTDHRPANQTPRAKPGGPRGPTSRSVTAGVKENARSPAVLVGGPIAQDGSPMAPELGDMGRRYVSPAPDERGRAWAGVLSRSVQD